MLRKLKYLARGQRTPNEVAGDILRNDAFGIPIGARQERRVQELRNTSRQLDGQELSLLNAANQVEFDRVMRNVEAREMAELLGYKAAQAEGRSISNPERFEKLMGQEKARRKKAKREELGRNINRGAAVVLGAGALGAGAATAATLANDGMFPFSLNAADGDVGELAKKAALIEREQEKRAFEDLMAQETVASQTKLANDLYARQQRGALDTQLALAQQSALTGQGAGGAPIDIKARVQALANEFVGQGVEPSVAINRAIDIISMDGRANNYL